MEARAVRLILALGDAKRQGIHEIEIILTRGSRASEKTDIRRSSISGLAIEVFLSRTG